MNAKTLIILVTAMTMYFAFRFAPLESWFEQSVAQVHCHFKQDRSDPVWMKAKPDPLIACQSCVCDASQCQSPDFLRS